MDLPIEAIGPEGSIVSPRGPIASPGWGGGGVRICTSISKET